MPARKRGQEGKKPRSWVMMISELTRTETEMRIRRDHPDLARALDWLATRYNVFAGKEDFGFTVFTDWVLEVYPKAERNWPDDIPRFGPEGLYGPLFQTER